VLQTLRNCAKKKNPLRIRRSTGMKKFLGECMPAELVSQNLGISTDLSVLMPIRKGFIQASSAITYASRIRLVLNTLHTGRRLFLESELQNTISGPLERLRAIEAVRWCILENDTRLLLAVSFKGPWEPYIRVIQREAGKILDAVLCNCEGYEADHRSELGFPAFSKWVRKYQIRTEQFFSSSPDLTTDDLQYLRTLSTAQRDGGDKAGFDVAATRQTVLSPPELAAPVAATEPALYIQQWLKILGGFYALQKYFPDADPGGDPRLDGHFLRELTRSVLDDGTLIYTLPPKRLLPYAPALAWLAVQRPADKKDPPSERTLLRENIQSGVLSPFEKATGNSNATHTRGLLSFLRFRGPQGGKAFLQAILPQLTKDSDRQGEFTLNIALTYAGLKTLGLSLNDLGALPQEFREGMDTRAGVLRDVRSNNPRNWSRPPFEGAQKEGFNTELSTIDCLLQWQAINEKQVPPPIPNGADVVAIQPLQRHPNADGKYNGHFDFTDNLSQPKDPFSHRSHQDYTNDETAKGDLLLGYKNIHGDVEPVNELLLDGTFMALRKLKQDVRSFRRFVSTASRNANIPPEIIKAKIVGRFSDGTAPITSRKDNHFDYSSDPAGTRCPLHAHIRRANPRLKQTPRIVRRGFSYGTQYDSAPTNNDRGMIFMAYCASLAHQFEVIQGWINGGNSTGLLSAEADPMLGVAEPHKPRTLRFEHNGNIERFDMNEPKPAAQFVTLEWGLYFFVPSIAALKLLSTYESPVEPELPETLVEKARQAIHQLQQLELLQQKIPPAHEDDKASLLWKQLLEDLSARESGMTEAIWSLVRKEHGGVLRTSYGVLIGSRETVMDALRDSGEKFSVRRYWQRMKATIGAGYLGMDRVPTSIGDKVPQSEIDLDKDYLESLKEQGYEQEAPCPNKTIHAISEEDAFTLTLNVARQILKKENEEQGATNSFVINLEKLSELVLAQLAEVWFGLPSKPHTWGDLLSTRPRNFFLLGNYIFNAQPTKYSTDLAEKIGPALTSAVQDVVNNPPAAAKLLNSILACSTDNESKVRTLTGIIQGFITPTYGSLLSVFTTLINEKTLWRLQQEWVERSPGYENLFAAVKQILLTPLINTMRAQPLPSVLHRVATTPSLVSGAQINTGDTVILGLISGAREVSDSDDSGKTELLFGGNYGVSETSHPCPGKDMALGVMLGALLVILDAGNLRNDAPLTLSVRQNVEA